MKVLLVLVTLAYASARVRYDGYKLLQVTPQNADQVDYLRWLSSENTWLDFWTEPRGAGIPVDVMLSPEHAANAASLFQDIPITVREEDVQKSFDAILDNVNPGIQLELDNYNSLEAIDAWLFDLPNHCPPLHTCELRVIGLSHEGREVKGFYMHRPGFDRRLNFIDATTHAREWISTMTVVRFMDNLVKQYDFAREAELLADEYDWFFVPMVNPDGYHYSFEEDNMWRKNRRFINATENTLNCTGVDLNRNYDYMWATEGSSNLYCSGIFHGPSAASEVETQHIQNIMTELNPQVYSMTTVHSYGYMWLFSWGTTVDHAGDVCDRTDYHEQIMWVADATANAMEAVNGNNWARGTSCEVIYSTSGSTQDYGSGAQGFKYSFTPELRGNSFQPPPFNIDISFREFFWGMEMKMHAIYQVEGF